MPVFPCWASRVIFTTEDGVTCVCELGSVEVQFEDLLQPLPQSLLPNQVFLFLATYCCGTIRIPTVLASLPLLSHVTQLHHNI